MKVYKAAGRESRQAEPDYSSDSDAENNFELACDIRVEQFVTGSAAPSYRQQKQTTLSFQDGVLIAKVQAANIRIPMAGPKAKVTVHCSQMAQGDMDPKSAARCQPYTTDLLESDCHQGKSPSAT